MFAVIAAHNYAPNLFLRHWKTWFPKASTSFQPAYQLQPRYWLATLLNVVLLLEMSCCTDSSAADKFISNIFLILAARCAISCKRTLI